MRKEAIPKLSRLRTATRAELLAIWTATLGKPPQFRASRELLASALAWQLQERKFGGLNAAAEHKLRVLARCQRCRQSPTQLVRSAGVLRAGTVLIRHWRGVQHMVTVLTDGYQYRGKVYSSLSRLAQEITGTSWSGPAFFGLRKRRGRTAGGDHGGQ